MRYRRKIAEKTCARCNLTNAAEKRARCNSKVCRAWLRVNFKRLNHSIPTRHSALCRVIRQVLDTVPEMIVDFLWKWCLINLFCCHNVICRLTRDHYGEKGLEEALLAYETARQSKSRAVRYNFGFFNQLFCRVWLNTVSIHVDTVGTRRSK